MEEGFVTANGVRLHYVAKGSGRRIVFVHGFPEFWQAWENQLEDFGKDHHAIAPDMRGYNLSDKPEGVDAYSVEVLLEDVRAFIQSFGPEPVVVVAHDWGGICAWHFAAKYPELITKLVIINSPHPATLYRELRTNGAQQEAMRYVLTFRKATADALLRENDFARLAKLFGSWEIGGHKLSPDTVAAYKSAWAQPGALNAMLNYYRATDIHPPGPGEPGVMGMNPDLSRWIVRVPTQVIWGEQDGALLPALLDGLQDYVPDLRIDRIPEGTHWVAHEFPERVNGLIREFLSGG